MAQIAPTGRQHLPSLDTGREVDGPHDPQPAMHADDALLSHLAELHDTAQSTLNAHRQELEEQVSYHEGEIARSQRVLAACERAREALQPEGPTKPGIREQLAEQRQRDPFITG